MMAQTNFAENVMGDLLNEMLNIPVMNKPISRIKRPMHTDVKEYADKYLFEVELPGFSRDEIHAELKNGTLTIAAEKKSDAENVSDDGKYIRKERYAGRCERSFVLEKEVRKEDVQAAFADGILTITIPKTQVEKEEDNSIKIL